MKLSDMKDIEDACLAVAELQCQADSDLCGEVREWMLPRISRIFVAMCKVFPDQSVQAMMLARDPYGDLVVEKEE